MMGIFGKIVSVLLVFALAFMLTDAPAFAGFREGVEAYERGDYERAYRELLPLAEGGHAEAQAGLGMMYMEGDGVSRDLVEAYKWVSLSAMRGDGMGRRILRRLERKLTPDQIAEGEDRLRLWKETRGGAGTRSR